MCEIAALIERLDLPEGTVLLVKMPEGAGEEQFDLAAQAVEPVLPPGVKFLLMPHDYEVSVIKDPELSKEEK